MPSLDALAAQRVAGMTDAELFVETVRVMGAWETRGKMRSAFAATVIRCVGEIASVTEEEMLGIAAQVSATVIELEDEA